MKLICFLLLLLFNFFPGLVQAEISVSPIIVDLLGEEADAEIAVRNLDKSHNAYVEVLPFQLTNPADPKAQKIRVKNPEKDGLLVFPAKLVLLPGQTQFVRVIKTAKSLDQDKVYEVDIVPKVATRILRGQGPDGTVLGIRVLVGYGVRVTLRPDRPRPALSLKRQKGLLTISNTGNTALRINSFVEFNGKAASKEIPLPAYTLFVGQTLKKTVNEASKLSLDASYMGKPLGPFYIDE